MQSNVMKFWMSWSTLNIYQYYTIFCFNIWISVVTRPELISTHFAFTCVYSTYTDRNFVDIFLQVEIYLALVANI